MRCDAGDGEGGDVAVEYTCGVRQAGGVGEGKDMVMAVAQVVDGDVARLSEDVGAGWGEYPVPWC